MDILKGDTLWCYSSESIIRCTQHKINPAGDNISPQHCFPADGAYSDIALVTDLMVACIRYRQFLRFLQILYKLLE